MSDCYLIYSHNRLILLVSLSSSIFKSRQISNLLMKFVLFIPNSTSATILNPICATLVVSDILKCILNDILTLLEHCQCLTTACYQHI